MERREARRFELDTPVIFRWKDERQIQCEGAGFSRDISTRGVFVISPSAVPPVASKLDLLVILPAFDPRTPRLRLRSSGSVVRVESIRGEFGVGIASSFATFDGLDRPAFSSSQETPEAPFSKGRSRLMRQPATSQ